MKIPLVWILSMFGTLVLGQRQIDRQVDLKGVNAIKISAPRGDIEVSNHSSSHLQINGNILINLGESDESFFLKMDRIGDTLHVLADIAGFESLPRYVHSVGKEPAQYMRLDPEQPVSWPDIREAVDSKGITMGVLVEISLGMSVPPEIPLLIHTEHGHIRMSNCSNPVTASSIYGEVSARLPTNYDRPLHLDSQHGFVEVVIDSDRGADVEMQTNFGHLFSNCNLQIDVDRSINEVFNTVVSAKLNSGGPGWKLYSAHSNVYLRRL